MAIGKIVRHGNMGSLCTCVTETRGTETSGFVTVTKKHEVERVNLPCERYTVIVYDSVSLYSDSIWQRHGRCPLTGSQGWDA